VDDVGVPVTVDAMDRGVEPGDGKREGVEKGSFSTVWRSDWKRGV